ncbi:MAG: hypothetical protein IPP33_18925 [Flavobacteriales bacterium]|nr:hypothetical protein [Flavobacteriales bacterium]
MGKAYWQGPLDWIRTTMGEQHANINLVDMELFSTVDTAEEAVDAI